MPEHLCQSYEALVHPSQPDPDSSAFESKGNGVDHTVVFVQRPCCYSMCPSKTTTIEGCIVHRFLCTFVGLCELVYLFVFVSACGSTGMYTSMFGCVPVYIYIMFVSVCVSLYMSMSSGASRRLCTSDFLFVCMSVYV